MAQRGKDTLSHHVSVKPLIGVKLSFSLFSFKVKKEVIQFMIRFIIELPKPNSLN